jgi:hypothetical protein
MIRASAGITALLFLASPVAAQDFNQCRHEAERDARVQASSSERLVLIARGGSLRVEGRAGISEVRVSGRACASSAELLERLRIEASRSGGAVRVEVPEMDHDGSWGWGRNEYARLDLVLEVPAGMAADIEDGSGDIRISGIGSITLDDGSGDIDIRDITGDVVMEDGSGGVVITGVKGSVTIDDGSGEIEVRDVSGSVTIDDGSGEIDVSKVGGTVRIPDDGTGSIQVSDVEGDLIVRDKGNGSVRYSDVRGRVDVPEQDRKRRRGR